MNKDIAKLNSKYIDLKPIERIEQLFKDFSNVLFTSSFGTSSGILLHMFAKTKPKVEVVFLNTTYHFKETLEYKDRLTKLWNLNVRELLPEEWKNEFTKQDQTWSKDPDMCCSINKVEPLDKIKADYQVWVSGLMKWQSPHREQMNVFEQREDIVKFHPLLDITESDWKSYLKENKIPEHPLFTQGYSSVGCFHCTTKGKGRKGRWTNKSKVECGLHL